MNATTPYFKIAADSWSAPPAKTGAKNDYPASTGPKREVFDDFCDRVSARLNETQGLIETIDRGLFEDVTNELTSPRAPDEQREVYLAADRFSRMMTVLAREVAGAKALVDDRHDAFLEQPSIPGPDPRWLAALELYEEAESRDTTGMSDAEVEKLNELAADSLRALIAMRAPNLHAVLDKLRTLRDTDTIGNAGFVDELVLDVEALTAA